MTSALLAGNAAIVLFGVIRGRSTLTSWAADSYRNVMTCVTSRSPPAATGPTVTAPPCCFASASGTTFDTPSPSTTVKPCSRSADSSVGYTRLFGTGRAEMMLIVPLTRGSIRKFLPVISATAFTTASMSALTKLSVTVSSAAARAGVVAGKAAHRANRSATRACQPRKAGRATAERCTGSQRFVVKQAPGRSSCPRRSGQRGENCTNRSRASNFAATGPFRE
jgi:hypothetical protein